MRNKRMIPAVLTIFLSSCFHNDQQKVTVSNKDSATLKIPIKTKDTLKDIGYYKVDGDSIIIPSFEIEIKLSPKAESRIRNSNETIIVSAMFSGVPKDTTSEEYQNNGEISIANCEIELSNRRVAKVENIKFSKSVYNSLAVKDIELLVNVFTGRKSSKDNLLDCPAFIDKMSNVTSKKITMPAKLIYGDD